MVQPVRPAWDQPDAGRAERDYAYSAMAAASVRAIA